MEDLFEEKLQYHQPVQGWYYNSRDDDDVGYYFTPSAFPISDQTPWFESSVLSHLFTLSSTKTPGRQLTNYCQLYRGALPYYRCTMNKNVTMVTNHPLFCTVQAAGLRASGSPYVSLPMDVTYGLNEATGSFKPIPSNAFFSGLPAEMVSTTVYLELFWLLT